jgi:L-gulono-1,4-lactone dehydrogenase
VKVVGGAHSWSDCAMTDHTLVSLDAMNRLVKVDKQRAQVTVEGGMRLHALNDALAAEGLALPIVGSIADQSVAGLVATGTHGSSLHHPNLSAHVKSMRLVDGRGGVVDIDAADTRLAGARLALGALGIVTQVTLAVEPAFTVVEEMEPTTFEGAMAALPTLARDAEYAKLWWFPHTNRALLFRGRRADAASTFSVGFRVFDTQVINGVVFRALLAVGAAVPSWIPALNRGVALTYGSPRRVTGRSDQVLSLAMPPRHRECEWAVPLASGEALLRGMRQLVEERGHRVNFIQEARFVRGDDTWMSPAEGGDVVQVGAYTGNPRGASAFFGDFAALARSLNGRPHWGKEAEFTPEDVARWYPRAGEFRALAHALDPEGVFRNAFTERLGV